MDWTTIAAAISTATNQPFTLHSATPVGGGCINEAFALEGSSGKYFIKMNRPALLDMFEAEAAALEEIRKSSSVHAPEPLDTGQDEQHSWLLMEFITTASAGPASSALLGTQLAAMHQHTAARFGWHRDNYIGETEQPNRASDDWVEFLGNQRLGFQLELAQHNGAPSKLRDSGQRLIQALPCFFSNYQPLPSLLHGDLWAGNWACSATGQPLVFDPAVYYGDREADLAMTELFGGFDDRFYQSYVSAWAIDPGYQTRKVLYNLYHILNHFNLFGGGYARQAAGMIDRLLAETA